MSRFRVCYVCRSLIPVTGSRSNRKYCCNACRQLAYRKRKAPKERKKRADFGERYCESCWHAFTAKHPLQRYCSDACRQIGYRKRKAAREGKRIVCAYDHYTELEF